MTSLKLIIVIAATLVFAIVLPAQETLRTEINADTNVPKKAILIDEFGPKGEEEIGAITDSFFIQINDDPTARGYILNYKGLDTLPSDLETWPNKALMMRSIVFRKYDMARVVFIDAGFREKQITQLYLVPDGAEPPVPTETIRKPKLPKTTYLGTILGRYRREWRRFRVRICPARRQA